MSAGPPPHSSFDSKRYNAQGPSQNQQWSMGKGGGTKAQSSLSLGQSRHFVFHLLVLLLLLSFACYCSLVLEAMIKPFSQMTSTKNCPETNDEDLFAKATYSQLLRHITEKYGPPNSTKDQEEQLRVALRIMEFVESDGIPTPITGFPFLYVGGVGAAYNLKALQQEQITHIISLSNSAPPKFPKRFKYLHVKDVHDNGDKNDRLGPHFASTFDFIEHARNLRGKVYVHCWKGERRSVTIVIAYLMKKYGMAQDVALRLIRTTRPNAKPSKAYWKELWEYEKMLHELRKQVKRQHNHN